MHLLHVLNVAVTQLEESHTCEEPATPVSKREMKAEEPLEPKKVQQQQVVNRGLHNIAELSA